MARLRSAPTSQQPATTASQPKRPALKEKTNTTRAKATVYDDDGETDGLVKDARPRRGRPKKVVQQEDEFIMAGGLGQAGSEDKTMERSAPAPTTNELVKSDAPIAVRGTRRPAARATKKTAEGEADGGVMNGVKGKMQATSRTQVARTRKQDGIGQAEETAFEVLPTKSPPVQERSEFSISPSPPPPGKLSSVSRQRTSLAQPGSALRSHETPAVETSILALKNFKRRPRQPSMLQMVQQRTASARPSGVGARVDDDPDVYDLVNDEDELEDFEPEAEGTPLHVTKKGQQGKAASKRVSNARQEPHSAAKPSPVANTRKRKSGDVDTSSSALEPLRAKRRKSSPAHRDEEPQADVRRSVSVQQTSPARLGSSPPKVTADVQVIHSSVSSTPPTEPSSPAQEQPDMDEDAVIPSTEKEREGQQYALRGNVDDAPEIDADGTMAEPASSSPPAEEPPTATQRTDIMADPLTQMTPLRPQRDKPKKNKKTGPVTTASLQNLMPKRRQPPKPRPRKSECDIDSESENDDPLDTSLLEGDEDELGGKLRRKTKSKPSAKGKKGKAAAAQSKPRQSKANAQTARKSSAALPPRKATATKKPAKTYGRAAAASDKENNYDGESADGNDDSVLPDNSMSMYEAARSRELEAAKKKFAKVDEWDMEFESMSFEEHRSSSQGWR
ncbi:uncharacterized protein LTR77_007869 [Saxophila tyrrhenica]|uniref:Uncharacterized protein n=1 Tax=Saxophila tyrrhenica TaxID=1690608 RepID=A0AAV9P595_9PEZI|nr:hypothetical protein LTR77_007869 [Saxophila tyrrhenica]